MIFKGFKYGIVVSIMVCSVRRRNCCLGLISFMFDWIFVRLEEIQERHKISNEFKLFTSELLALIIFPIFSHRIQWENTKLNLLKYSKIPKNSDT